MINLSLDPDIEREVRQEAEAQGLSTDQYIKLLIEEKYSKKLLQNDSYEVWHKVLMEFVGVRMDETSLLSDEAISRDSIYTREDEML